MTTSTHQLLSLNALAEEYETEKEGSTKATTCASASASASSSNSKRSDRSFSSPNMVPILFLGLLLALSLPTGSFSFAPTAQLSSKPATSGRCGAILLASPDEDLPSRLERAKAILEKSRAKLASATKEPPSRIASASNLQAMNGGRSQNLPFFAAMAVAATPGTDGNKREVVIKSVDEKTGLITTDGEKMASLSEKEEWEVRGLLDLFENEIEDKASDRFADRDVVASIWNLRKSLQQEDYRRIFDSKNRFIGEDN